MLIIDGTEYGIRMLGYIWDAQLLIGMPGIAKEVIPGIFENAKSIVYVNADGVKTDYSKMKFAGFLEDMVILK